MAKKTKYCQCILRRDEEIGYAQTVSWIPQQFAVNGKIIKLKNECDNKWVEWVVVSASDPEPEEQIANYHRDMKWYLKNTGDNVSAEAIISSSF